MPERGSPEEPRFGSGLPPAGPKRRELGTEVPRGLRLPPGVVDVRVALPGVLAMRAPKHPGLTAAEYEPAFVEICDALDDADLDAFPMITLVDDAEFAAAHFKNWIWATFTRANPATDLLGVRGAMFRKHFGCRGPVVLDARWKPHMAPPLVEDPAVTRRVDELASRGGPLAGLLG